VHAKRFRGLLDNKPAVVCVALALDVSQHALGETGAERIKRRAEGGLPDDLSP
jgi:hypothetical protein